MGNTLTSEQIKSFDNYVRLFNLTGLRVLINDLFIRVYPDYGFLILIKEGDYFAFISPEGLARCHKEGASFFEDEDRFKNYLIEVRNFISDHESFRKDFLVDREIINTENLENFFDRCIKILDFYKYTDFNFSDGAYERAKELNDPKFFERLEEFGRFKNEMRDFINSVFVKTDSDLEKLLKVVSEKFDLPVADLKEYRYEEVIDLVRNHQKIDSNIISSRSLSSLLYNDNGEVKYLWGEKAREIFDHLVVFEKEKITELKGVGVSAGRVTGAARVIYADYDDISKLNKFFDEMREGEILISETTSPDLLPACKKAAAIVTNQGGMISHAAIVSREMKLPCVVGVKDATKIIKTGDVVEVDGGTGIVRIING